MGWPRELSSLVESEERHVTWWQGLGSYQPAWKTRQRRNSNSCWGLNDNRTFPRFKDEARINRPWCHGPALSKSYPANEQSSSFGGTVCKEHLHALIKEELYVYASQRRKK